jgi:hypothetical protein
VLLQQKWVSPPWVDHGRPVTLAGFVVVLTRGTTDVRRLWTIAVTAHSGGARGFGGGWSGPNVRPDRWAGHTLGSSYVISSGTQRNQTGL